MRDKPGLNGPRSGLLVRLGMVVIAALLACPPRAQAASCDYTGFEQPCRVADGYYRVLVPEGEGPFPVLVYLYGSGGHSITITNHPFFQETIVDRGYMLVVPAARELTYVGGVRDTGWALRHEAVRSRDEIAFLRQVMENLAQRFAIDRSRILIAGQSRGGFLTWEIACHAPELATAFAVHGGGYLGELPEHCRGPVRMLDTHGLKDAVVPMRGRDDFSGGADLPSLVHSLGVIARTNECQTSGMEDEGTEFFGFDRRSWKGCRSGSGLDLMLHPGGHGMPWIWFRAVLDWFEEPQTAEPAAKPVTRTVGGDRPSGVFRGAERPSGLLTSSERPAGLFKAPPAPKPAE